MSPDYIPSDDVDTTGHFGANTRQGSRTLEVREALSFFRTKLIIPLVRFQRFFSLASCQVAWKD
jgi:hypothetical protein